jgi:hypothetical protein
MNDENSNAVQDENTEPATMPMEAAAVYQYLTLEEAESYIEGNLVTAARVYVANGYFLKRIRDDRLYEEDGYSNFDEYVQAKYGKKKDWASRCIKVNAQLSVGGDSPNLDSRYHDYSTYQLVELAYMTEEQREQATPAQTVKELREIRKPKEIPYVETPGQTSFEADFPEIFPTVGIETQQPDTPQEFDMDVEDLISEEVTDAESETVVTVATSEKSGKCLYQPEYGCTLEDKHKHIPGDGTDCGHQCCWDCSARNSCNINCYSSARREVFAAFSQHEPDACCENAANQSLSAYGFLARVYPPGSLLNTKGCKDTETGSGHDCFCCHMDGCQIRQEACWCVEAPCGNPFPCTTLNVVENLQDDIGERCQFVNKDHAIRREGDGEPVPCCKECNDPCGYECNRSRSKRWEKIKNDREHVEQEHDPDQKAEVIDAEFHEMQDGDEVKAPKQYDHRILESMIAEVKDTLDAMQDYWKANQPHTYTRHIMELQALRDLLTAHENSEPEDPEPEQVELPLLKNNDQRASFIDSYETWPVWIETEETGEKYYRYDLPDGTSIVVKVYHAMLFDYKAHATKYEERFSEGYGRHEYYLLHDGKFFRDCETNRSALIEKLKEIQKKGE